MSRITARRRIETKSGILVSVSLLLLKADSRMAVGGKVELLSE